MPAILFLTAYPREDASCRYRVHQFLPFLENAGYKCEVAPFCSGKLFAALKSKGKLGLKTTEMVRCSVKRFARLRDVSSFAAVVIHREAFPFFAPVAENWLTRRHPKVVFSFDDAIYAGHDDLAGLSHPILYRCKHGKGYDEVIRRSAHVIAGNRILAEHARQLNPNVSVVPTVVDCDKYCFRWPMNGKSQPLTIGWIGSRSTAPYLALVEPALRRIAENHCGRVRFRFIGCPDYQPLIPDSSSVPFRLDREIEDLQSLDIGLMPLPDTAWTRGKCAFKAIQYMASGIPVVASPVGITSDVIHHNVNGLLACTEDEWFCELNRLVEDAALRQRLAVTARRTIEDSYSLELWGPRLVKLFDQFIGVRKQHETVAA